MEYIDLLDADGNKAGETKEKGLVHRDGDWHKSVHVWIVNSKNELLLQRRSPDKKIYPDMWDISAAGHVSAGEDSITGAMRETEEELGIKVPQEDFEFLFTCSSQATPNGYIENEHNDVYLIRKDLDLNSLKLQDEVAEVKFIGIGELEEIINNRQDDFVMHDEEYEKLFENLKKEINPMTESVPEETVAVEEVEVPASEAVVEATQPVADEPASADLPAQAGAMARQDKPSEDMSLQVETIVPATQIVEKIVYVPQVIEKVVYKEAEATQKIGSARAKELWALFRNKFLTRKKIKMEKIVTLAIDKKKITNDDVQKLLRVSDATATRYLAELVKQGMLKKTGVKAGTAYEVNA